MPGQLKEVRNRIRSVESIQQITKAMKMVSAAKLRRAQDAIQQMRPYALKLQEMLQHIAANSDGEVEMKLAEERPVEKVLLILITSDRGLCGSYNANLVKLAREHIAKEYAAQYAEGNVTIMTIGKKGSEYFTNHAQFLGRRAGKGIRLEKQYVNLFQELAFNEIQEASEAAMKGYMDGLYDKVDIVYSQFVNAVVQAFKVESFLPIPKATPDTKTEKEEVSVKERRMANFIFEPDEKSLVVELMPKILNTQLYKAMLDANASEHGARMTSMGSATDNADSLLHDLRISYNRARQAAITTELTEIVSGAAALEG